MTRPVPRCIAGRKRFLRRDLHAIRVRFDRLLLSVVLAQLQTFRIHQSMAMFVVIITEPDHSECYERSGNIAVR